MNRFADLVQDDRPHLCSQLVYGDRVERLRLLVPGLQYTMGVSIPSSSRLGLLLCLIRPSLLPPLPDRSKCAWTSGACSGCAECTPHPIAKCEGWCNGHASPCASPATTPQWLPLLSRLTSTPQWLPLLSRLTSNARDALLCLRSTGSDKCMWTSLACAKCSPCSPLGYPTTTVTATPPTTTTATPGYVMISSGTCDDHGGPIESAADCEAAAEWLTFQATGNSIAASGFAYGYFYDNGARDPSYDVCYSLYAYNAVAQETTYFFYYNPGSNPSSTCTLSSKCLCHA